MIAYHDTTTLFANSCPMCGGTGTVNCGTGCQAHYYDTDITSFAFGIAKTIKEISIDVLKKTFWEWLHYKFPTKLFSIKKVINLNFSNKKYFRRTMFCKSGYLPNRLRKKLNRA